MQHVWKPLGFVGQLIETLIGGGTLVWFVYLQPSKNLLSDLASYLPALTLLTSPLALLPDLRSVQPSPKEH